MGSHSPRSWCLGTLIPVLLATASCGDTGPTGTASPSAPAAPMSSVPATPAPPASSPPASLSPSSDWTLVELVAGERENVLAHRLSTGGPGLLAVGERYCDYPGASAPDPTACYAQLWVSETGVEWTLVRDPALAVSTVMPMSGPQPGLLDVAGHAELAVLLGYALDDAGPVAIWTVSQDLDVTRVDVGDAFAGARPKAVVAVDGGFVIVGTVLGRDRPRAAAWWSPDGLTWTQAPESVPPWTDVGGYVDTLEEPGYGGMTAATFHDGRIAAIGSTCDEQGTACAATGWKWRNRRVWERAAFDADGTATAVAWGGDDFVVFGTWESPHGPRGFYADWTGGWQTIGADWAPIHTAASVPNGAVVVGWNEGGRPVLMRWEWSGFTPIDPPRGTWPGGIRAVRGADIEIVDSRMLVIVATETDAGLEAFVLIGPLPD